MTIRLKILFSSFLIFGIAFHPMPISGDMIPDGVVVFGTYAFDTNGSFAPANANQSGTIFSVLGGNQNETSEYAADTVVSGNETISAVLTNHGGGSVGTGDGFGGTASVDATNTFPFRADTDLDGSNPDASPLNVLNQSTQIYRFDFSLSYNHQVEANGADAGIRSDFDLELDGVRIFNSELISDTVVGNIVDGSAVPGFGGPLSAAGIYRFSFVLTPGEFTEVGLDYTLESPVYASISTGQTIGTASYLLSLDNVSAVPEPHGVFVALAVMAIAFPCRKRMGRAMTRPTRGRA